MKIKSLQISNVLSYKYYTDINDAPKITFNDEINILIGQNGSGKSTALEVINFIFKRILFKNTSFNRDVFYNESIHDTAHIKNIVSILNHGKSYESFRLQPNWFSEGLDQHIRLIIEIDEIDKQNLITLTTLRERLKPIEQKFTNYHNVIDFSNYATSFTIDVKLNRDKNFVFTPIDDPAFKYLENYNYYKQLISVFNIQNPSAKIDELYESFALIGGYRNYNSFTPTVNLRDQYADQQIEGLKNNEVGKSTNAVEHAEPSIFNLVRLRVAQIHYDLNPTILSNEECEERANNQPFLRLINKKLKIVNFSAVVGLITTFAQE